jgi:hypothetical protein
MYVSPEGQQFLKRYGSRVSVFEMESYQTSSGLKRGDLKQNRRGRIVSKRRSEMMLNRYQKFGGLRRTKEEKEEKEEKPKQVQENKAPPVSRPRRRH